MTTTAFRTHVHSEKIRRRRGYIRHIAVNVRPIQRKGTDVCVRQSSPLTAPHPHPPPPPLRARLEIKFNVPPLSCFLLAPNICSSADWPAGERVATQQEYRRPPHLCGISALGSKCARPPKPSPNRATILILSFIFYFSLQLLLRCRTSAHQPRENNPHLMWRTCSRLTPGSQSGPRASGEQHAWLKGVKE